MINAVINTSKTYITQDDYFWYMYLPVNQNMILAYEYIASHMAVIFF